MNKIISVTSNATLLFSVDLSIMVELSNVGCLLSTHCQQLLASAFHYLTNTPLPFNQTTQIFDPKQLQQVGGFSLFFFQKMNDTLTAAAAEAPEGTRLRTDPTVILHQSVGNMGQSPVSHSSAARAHWYVYPLVSSTGGKQH